MATNSYIPQLSKVPEPTSNQAETDQEKSVEKSGDGASGLEATSINEGASSAPATLEDYPWRWKITALCLGIFLSGGRPLLHC